MCDTRHNNFAGTRKTYFKGGENRDMKWCLWSYVEKFMSFGPH